MSFFERPATSILHPTDFSANSEFAFAHALAIALENEADLTILHVMRDDDEDLPWHEYPSVRSTLERWGKLGPGSHRHDVPEKLGINIKKVVVVDKDIVKSIVELTEVDSFDLIVMATNENRENPFWSKSSVSIAVSQRSHLPTLFVPSDVRGCVSIEDGETSLSQVLIPVDHQPNAQPAIERIMSSIDKFGGVNSQITMLHVGDKDKFPLIDPPTGESYSWTTTTRHGNATNNIVTVAEELNADLIVMVTEGKKGFWDALLGSTVDHVLKKAPCLVFTMPADY